MNQEEFNKLLFNDKSGIINTLTIISLQTRTESILSQNISSILNYYQQHQKLDILFLWLFKQEFVIQPDIKQPFTEDSSFVIYHYYYCIQYLIDFFEKVTKPIINAELLKKINIELLLNYDQIEGQKIETQKDIIPSIVILCV